MANRLTDARNAIAAVFLSEGVTSPPSRAAYTALSITAYPIMKVRRIFGSWDRAMKLIVRYAKERLNSPPVYANPFTPQSVEEGQTLNYQFASNTFTDADGGQALTYSVVSKPDWVTFTPATRTFGGTAPAVTEDTDFDVVIKATDDFGVYTEATLVVTVTNAA